MEIRPLGVQLFLADGRTEADAHGEADGRFSQNFAKSAHKESWRFLWYPKIFMWFWYLCFVSSREQTCVWNCISDASSWFYRFKSMANVNPVPYTFYVLHIILHCICGPSSSVRGSNPGGVRFSARPDRPWGPPSLLYNRYRVFPGGKERPGRDADPSPLSSTVVMKG